MDNANGFRAEESQLIVEALGYSARVQDLEKQVEMLMQNEQESRQWYQKYIELKSQIERKEAA